MSDSNKSGSNARGSNRSNHRGSSPRSEARDSRGRFADSGVSFLEGARSRPAIAVAAVTAVAAAGAYLWSRRSSNTSSQPLMRWGQSDDVSATTTDYDSASAAASFDNQARSSFDSAYAPPIETASSSPSSSAGIGAGTGGSSPSELQSSIGSGLPSDSGDQTTKRGNTGLDELNQDETKVGSVAYGS